MKTRHKAMLATIALWSGLLLGSDVATAQPQASPLSAEKIAEILASPDRSAADRTNDLRRKPEQLLPFIGPRLHDGAARSGNRPDRQSVRAEPPDRSKPSADPACGSGRQQPSEPGDACRGTAERPASVTRGLG
jgi:hypothetical protein